MLCPTDGTQLVMSERSGVEIDYCPKCRGVWLDRGELDKIIDRAADAAPARAAEQPRETRYGGSREDAPRYGGSRDEDDHRGEGQYRKKRKEGFLGELFDF